MGMMGKQKKLLLADDSITIRKVVELVLADEGFELKLTSDGAEALDAVSSFRPDIILTDVDMPGLSGYQLTETIKNSPATRSIPVILMVGAFETVDEDLIKKAGADDYIIKPFESHDLISKLKNALSSRETPSGQDIAFSEGLEAEIAKSEAGTVHEIHHEAMPAQNGQEHLVAEHFVDEVAVPPVEETVFPAGCGTGVSPSISISAEDFKDEIGAQVSKSIHEAVGGLDLANTISQTLAPCIQAAALESMGSQLKALIPEIKASLLDAIVPGIKEAVTESVVSGIRTSIMESIMPEVRSAVLESLLPEIKTAITDAIIPEVKPVFTESVIPEIKNSVMRSVEPEIKQAVRDSLPGIMKSVMASTALRVAETAAEDIHKEIENIVRESVVQVAEPIIKKEIEAIKSAI